MELRQLFTRLSVLALVAMPLAPALADHGDLNPIDRLSTETRELHSMVSYSRLNFRVKTSVSRFAVEVDRLVACEARLPDGGGGGEPSDRDGGGGIIPLDHGDSENCDIQRSSTVRAFAPVERFLYDTYYDFNEIYHKYIEVRDALNAVRTGIR